MPDVTNNPSGEMRLMRSLAKRTRDLIRYFKEPVQRTLARRTLRRKYADQLDSLMETYVFFREHPHESFWGSITTEDEKALRVAVEMASVIGGPLVEMGALFGHTTQFIATTKPAGQKLIAVENFTWNPFGLTPSEHRAFMNRSLRYCLDHCNTEIFDGNSAAFFRTYTGPIPSMVFIDAGHSYEDVKSDIMMATSMRIPIICGHDYHPLHAGVMKAVDEIFGANKTVQGSVWVSGNPCFKAA